MKIKLNTEVREQRILNYYNEAIEKIAKNAEQGYNLTELIFPNDIFNDVRDNIALHMKAFNIDFVWQSIGNMNSVAVDEGRLMRFKLLK